MQRDIVKDRTFLARKSAPATADDAAVITDLRDTLAAHHDDCVGMAGNMIGSLTRIIIVTMGEKDVVMVNPVIIKRSGMYLTKEGCLSLEGVTRVKRYENITVAWQDDSFHRHVTSYSGWVAQIIQHEVDHLDGILV